MQRRMGYNEPLTKTTTTTTTTTKQSKIHTERKKQNKQTLNFYSSKFQENFQKKVQK